MAAGTVAVDYRTGCYCMIHCLTVGQPFSAVVGRMAVTDGEVVDVVGSSAVVRDQVARTAVLVASSAAG